jgi:hypothetical protein
MRRRRTARLCTSISTALTLVLLVGCGSQPHPVAYTDLTRAAGPLEFTRITRQLFHSAAELRDVLEHHNPGRPLRLPKIDFMRQEAYLVAAGPRSSTGYELRVVRVQEEGGRILVVVRERTPSLADRVEARVTYPFRLLALPRSDKPVKLRWLGRP